mgnify:CR=1 FL=1|jgi:Parvulin-like peptidyl-prolyl isomerase
MTHVPMSGAARRRAGFAAATMLMLGLALPAAAEDAKVLATVDGHAITTADVEIAKEAFAEELGRVPAGAQQNILVDVLVDMQILADAAEKAGIPESDHFKVRMEFLRKQALRNAFIEQKIQGDVSEEELKARYEKDVAGYAPPEEVHARHILVKTEDEAKALIEKLDAGEDFAKLASESSLDGTKANGGDLGFFTKGQMVPEFETAAFALEPGKYTEAPVKSQFGFHVIKVEEKRTQPVPTFEEVEAQVREVVSREKFTEVMQQLKDAAKVERMDQPAAEAPADGAAPAPAQ